ncbi:hypothetical protein L202_05033 [Cryptococcus amylolentus CBS 6039]|uniref:Acid phosphatase n=1 Tax=Cryptococcus amylolentus CBS 6039 TaxID=1295533 RepID=A0A1E3HNM8_9TREE|nr:hypothetical protein L202_05033 [Cryptococcus amylolentus CBS 6039]ODN77934.1 hypothetical protein L202_05033 [Cryptococcus amylolentus CBS 6039]
MAAMSISTLFGCLIYLSAGANALTHYPPANTSNTILGEVLNGTSAPGIYTSSHTPDDKYGEYNWCAMPHVREQEYEVPSGDYELQYVEVIQRHHKRTPYASNTFFKEDITWDCSNEGPYHYAKDHNGLQTAPVYWQAQTGTQNPFEYTVGPGFPNSTCEFPSITSQGLDDAFEHGKDLRSVYHDKLSFLPSKWEKDKFRFRVTNNVITSQTLSGLARGLFPGGDGSKAEEEAWIQSDAWDSLEPAFACELRDAVASAITDSTTEWGEHLSKTQELRQRFYNVSGIEPELIQLLSPYDNLSAKQCHGLNLPCSLNNTALCTSQEDANAIYSLGNYEYAYKWRMHENSTFYSALTMGPWFIELQHHINGKIEGSDAVKYFHNFAHDGSIAPVLGLLQIDEPFWPGMGSEVVFELFRNSKSHAYYIRVLVSGQPLKTSTPLGTLEMVPWDEFETYLAETIPRDMIATCDW